MIGPTMYFLPVRRVALEQLVVTEKQPRYPERILHYWRLLTAAENRDNDVGPITVAPCPHGNDGDAGRFEIRDGHHRYYASLMAGRTSILALILIENAEQGYTLGERTTRYDMYCRDCG